MAKKQATKSKKLPPLKGIERTLLDYVINNAALGGYSGGCCGVDDLAIKLRRNPRRFRSTINGLVEQGYLSLGRGDNETVYPTAVALMHQSTTMTEAEAKRLVAKVKRG